MILIKPAVFQARPTIAWKKSIFPVFLANVEASEALLKGSNDNHLNANGSLVVSSMNWNWKEREGFRSGHSFSVTADASEELWIDADFFSFPNLLQHNNNQPSWWHFCSTLEYLENNHLISSTHHILAVYLVIDNAVFLARRSMRKLPSNERNQRLPASCQFRQHETNIYTKVL